MTVEQQLKRLIASLQMDYDNADNCYDAEYLDLIDAFVDCENESISVESGVDAQAGISAYSLSFC